MMYLIKSGDTLSAISARYGVSVSELAMLNNIRNASVIFAGDTLNIPTMMDINPISWGKRLRNWLFR